MIGRRGVWAVLALVLCAGILVAPPVAHPDSSGPAVAADPGTPDVIVVMTDDQRVGTQRGMPYLWGDLRNQMVNYSNAQVPVNNCCPSRSTFLSGASSNRTKVWDNTNAGSPGGWRRFMRSGYEKRTLAVALQRRGYHTALMGKYLNQFAAFNDVRSGVSPPGWDEFFTYLDSNGGYWSPGTPVRDVPEGYTTDTLGDTAVKVITGTPADQPLFLLYTPYAPHEPFDAGPYKGAARDAGRLDDFRRGGAWTNPSIGNGDRREKPVWNRKLPGLTDDGERPSPYPRVRHVSESQADTLMGVDANIAKIVAAQQATRDWDNTLFVFMSDNGYAWGDHALFDKTTPYRMTNEVPLMIKYPAASNMPQGTADHRLINNIDVTATIAAVSGASMATEGIPAIWPVGRTGLSVQSPQSKRGYPFWHPAYCGWRTKDHLYVRWSGGEEELYDYRSDPWEQHNLIDASVYQDQRARMTRAAHAACVPAPPKYESPLISLTLSVPRRGTLAARVAPALYRTPVTVQRYRSGHWGTVGVCRLPRSTTSSHRRIAVPSSGTYRAKAIAKGGYRSAWSKTVGVRARHKSTFRCG
ncbi:MAG: sulfatase-like hydrolase/transferase [Candidatus Nanopelagicales bacterium]